MRVSNMRPLSIVVVLFVFAVVSVLVMGSSAQNLTQAANSLAKEPVSYRDVVKKVLPAVVSIDATTKQVSTGPGMLRWRDDWRLPQEYRKFFEDLAGETEWPETIRHGMGSGFIIDPKGVVVTNHHVVKGATEVTVRLQDGRQFTATDIKSDPKTDLAVIRFDAKSNLPHLEFDDSSAMEIGDRVLAAGAPFGLAGSVSAGIISGKGRKFNSMAHEDFLQTDSAINPGNSGGPLVNLAGKVVGINTAIRSNSGGSQGVGLAISSNVARDIVDRLLKDGAVQRGYLGVQLQRLDPEVGARLGVENNKGVVVARVMDGSPAAKAGIQAGDVLLSVQNHDISDPADLQRRIMAIKPKSTVPATVWRDRKPLELTITIEEQPSHTMVSSSLAAKPSTREGNAARVDELGVECANMTPMLRKRHGIPEGRTGAVVSRVVPGSLAFIAGLREGAVITKVDNVAVTSAQEAQSALEKATVSQGVVLQLQYPDSGVGYVMIKSTPGR